MDAPKRLTLDPIVGAEAQTLSGLFLRRCERTPEGEAYRQYDAASAQWRSYAWRDMQTLAARWQAALSLGLVVVPLYITDNAESANAGKHEAHAAADGLDPWAP